MNYFLLDACALVAYYCEDEPENIRAQVRRLFAAHADGEAFLYVPNFCVAETLRAFAKKCWTEGLYGKGPAADAAFKKFRDAFLADVRESRILYSYELSRRHILLTDKIYEGASKLSYRKGNPPGAFDVLAIAMGIDLARIHGADRLLIVTAEAPIFDVCTSQAGFPKAVNIRVRDIPKVFLD